MSAGGTMVPAGTSPASPMFRRRSRLDDEMGSRLDACCCWIVCLKSSTVAGFGGCTRVPGEAAAVDVLTRFVLPVSHMIRTMTTATLRMTSCCVFFGRSPAGLGVLFSTVPRNCAVSVWLACSFVSGMGYSLLSCGGYAPCRSKLNLFFPSAR